MTNDAIAGGRRRAAECLRAAELCLHAGLYADAVSRAHYSVFHIATALISLRGLKAKSQRGLHMLVKEEFIDTALLEPGLGPEMPRLHRLRETADYHPNIPISESNAADACHTAARLLDAANPLLDEAPSLQSPGG